MRRGALTFFLLLLIAPVVRPQGAPPAEAVEQQVVARTNQFRQQNSLPPLVPSSALRTAARTHSEEMAKMGDFEHESPVAARRYPWDRVALAGADADSIAENIFEAVGAPMSEVAAVAERTWENSAEHRANMLDATKTHVGVGVFISGKHIFVTQVLSSPVTDR